MSDVTSSLYGGRDAGGEPPQGEVELGLVLALEPEREAAAADALTGQQLTAVGITDDPGWVRYCRMSFQDYVSLMATQADKAMHRLSAKLAAGVFGYGERLGHETHGEYNPQVAHYFLRRSRWPEVCEGPIGLCTYVAPIFSRHLRPGLGGGKLRYITYPPSPLTTTLFAAIPGRAAGEFVMNRETRAFYARPIPTPNEWLSEQLNREDVISQISELLSRDYDDFGDGPVRRDYDVVSDARRARPLAPERGVDPYFLPTLFENDWLDFRLWPGYPIRPTKRMSRLVSARTVTKSLNTMRTYDPAKYFALVLLPFREWTIAILNWPTASRFERSGELEATDFGLAYVKNILAFLTSLLSDERSHLSGSEARPHEQLGYWDVVRKVSLHPEGKLESYNLPVLPFEWMLESLGGNRA